MSSLKIYKTLLEYEVPLVVLAKNDKAQNYLGVNYDDGESGYLFYFSRINPENLHLLLTEKIDVHYAVTRAHKGRYEFAETWGVIGEEFKTIKSEELNPELLPKPGMFIPGHAPVSSDSATRIVDIDGRWEVSDLKKFSDLVQDCYAFGYALLSETGATSRSIERLFHKYPWRGGFSAVNFFRSLYKGIPRQDRADIKSITYASPGQIKFIVNATVAESIRDLIVDLNTDSSMATESYRYVQRMLQDRGWTGKAEEDLELDEQDKAELQALLATGCNGFGLKGHEDHIIGLASGDLLASVKIILAYYRRLKLLADYVSTGKAQNVFHA
ncbi:hypothetical protein DK254_15945 [Pseudomonas sp. RW407]|uniref:hypothetical protein n=1 Tax=Pseudomonas sp. RW407 TaxID=2202894 RepID=UPI000D6EC3E1|nr:hypothetical protein [Pseudomonas sp. RW407]PWU29610.1 hypothetical protein DK254_15945 [Pseudomonas sp. RW407]